MTSPSQDPRGSALVQLDDESDTAWRVGGYDSWTFGLSIGLGGATVVKQVYQHANKQIDFPNGTSINKDFFHVTKTASMELMVDMAFDIGPFYWGGVVSFEMTDVLVNPVNEKAIQYTHMRIRLCETLVRECGAFCELDGKLEGYSPSMHDKCPGEGQAPATKEECEGHHGLMGGSEVRWAKWIDDEADCTHEIQAKLYGLHGGQEGMCIEESETDYQPKLFLTGGKQSGNTQDGK
jgi:hypothetical protein